MLEVCTELWYMLPVVLGGLLFWFGLPFLLNKIYYWLRSLSVTVRAKAPPGETAIAVEVKNTSNRVVGLGFPCIEAKGLKVPWLMEIPTTTLEPGTLAMLSWEQQEMVRRMREADLSLPRKCRVVFTVVISDEEAVKCKSEWFILWEPEPTEQPTTKPTSDPAGG